MGVDFSCGDAGVAEQFLDETGVDAVLQQLSGRCVAQHVGGNRAGQVQGVDVIMQVFADLVWRYCGSALSNEKVLCQWREGLSGAYVRS